MTSVPPAEASDRARSTAATINRITYWFCHHWLFVFSVILGLYVGLPWLAPIFMKLGWTNAANGIYLFYATQCHQLPERSFFLFGEKGMYSLAEVQAAWQNTNNPVILRQFVGNEAFGWKVAWSDRMVSMYTAVLFFGWVYRPLAKRITPLSTWLLLLFLLPMALDGGTHMISDVIGGIGGGFRDSNLWLASLTGHAFSADFYAGDALGSFNSWMRLFSGLSFAIGVVWWAYPRLEEGFEITAGQIETKFEKAGVAL